MQIPLKRPYVKKGAVPSLFPWTEFVDGNSTIENIESAPLRQTNNTEREVSSNILTFNELKCNDKLFVPMGWTRNVLPLENTTVIIFSKMICKTIGTESHLICTREI